MSKHTPEGEIHAMHLTDSQIRMLDAAPELLEALTRMITVSGEGNKRGRAIDLIDRKTWNAALAAIAKAEGRK